MFNFLKRKVSIADSGILKGMTDYHSHLLPGVDDGVKTMAETLKILEEMEKQGIRKVWFTPHIMEDIPNKTADLQAKFAEVQAAYQGNIVLHLATENMLDNLFENVWQMTTCSLSRKTASVTFGRNFLFQSSDGLARHTEADSAERILPLIGASGTIRIYDDERLQSPQRSQRILSAQSSCFGRILW